MKNMETFIVILFVLLLTASSLAIIYFYFGEEIFNMARKEKKVGLVIGEIFCGDSVCNGAESCFDCSQDCGSCRE